MANTRMPKPPQGVKVQGSPKGTASAPVGGKVKLASGRAKVDTKRIASQQQKAGPK